MFIGLLVCLFDLCVFAIVCLFIWFISLLRFIGLLMFFCLLRFIGLLRFICLFVDSGLFVY